MDVGNVPQNISLKFIYVLLIASKNFTKIKNFIFKTIKENLSNQKVMKVNKMSSNFKESIDITKLVKIFHHLN